MSWKTAGTAVVFSGLQILCLLALNGLRYEIILVLLASNLIAFSALSLKKAKPVPPTAEVVPDMDPTLKIANETLPYLRRGFNENTARKTAEIIQKISDVPAVAITDRERVLAYLGAGCEKHQPGDRILTEATKQVIATGRYKVVQTQEQLNCPVQNCDCPLAAAIIVPLKCQGEVIGSLKLYQTQDGHLPPHAINLAIGIAQLLGMQVELAELDRQTQLVTMAKLDALHAQINPHFFFNTLNTIIMYSRTNPTRARRLLIHLADFFRQTLKRHGRFVSVREELECVHTYLVLEKARFGKKLHIIQDVDPDLLEHQIPVLSLQPLVENAVKHGLTPKVESGAIKISIHREISHLVLSITDDGVGIPSDKVPLVLQPGYGSGNGVGLSNVHERLKGIYGEEYGLHINSKEGKGTIMLMRIPVDPGSTAEGGPEPYETKNSNS
ncbi:MAG: histidine kinase [Bacillota bacterium]